MNAKSSAVRTQASPEPMLLNERDGPIAILTLNRPEQRNCLSEAMLAETTGAIAAIRADQNIRALVITAKGPAFSAGHDLKELTARRSDADGGRAYFRQIMNACSDMMQAIMMLPKPVIAAVQGTATAAGCQLVASCDLAITSSAAKFATPGVNIGLFCSTPMVALSRNVARKHAMEMLLTGDAISADDAYRMGLVNRVVAPGQELPEALEMARKIVGKSTHSVKIGKEGFYRQVEMSLADAYRYVSEVMVENLMAADAEEGLNAFIEKRTPKWEGH